MKKIGEMYHDWNASPDYTLKERFEALYLFLLNAEKMFSAEGTSSVTMNSTLISLFDMSVVTTPPDAPLYVNGVLCYRGSTCHKWGLWEDPYMPYEQIQLSRGDEYIQVSISNLLWE